MARSARPAAQLSGPAFAWRLARLTWSHSVVARFRGGVVAVLGAAMLFAVATYNAADPSWNAATALPPDPFRKVYRMQTLVHQGTPEPRVPAGREFVEL